jgi:UDP-N-acetylmuramoyl-L-alanyl-D-glutamate--2,6-diaminopimelate ligase
VRVSKRTDELVASLRQRFPDLNFELAGHVKPKQAGGALVRFVTHDSRLVEPGALFCCIRGGAFDGHRFAEQAVADGATALLVDHPLQDLHVDQIVVSDTRKAMGPVSAATYDYPADKLVMIGITGTNGKTTTAHLLADILREAGKQAAVIGTLTQKRTTPEATDLQEQLAELVDSGITHVAMEVTSHALELHRVDGITYDIAVFTNLSQDHLDFHTTMEAYFRAKAKLFEPAHSRRAVVNADDTHGHLLATMQLVPTEMFSLRDVSELTLQSDRTSFTWHGTEFDLPMAGQFNVLNALGAATVALNYGVDLSAIAEALRKASVPGRYESVVAGQAFSVIVDFAHTPDGLERVLLAAQATLRNDARLITVFGCGGDRDRTKRSLMGAIASQVSDITIVTSDNPRSEDPQSIIDEILTGIPIDRQSDCVRVIVDRLDAIAYAIANARENDVVLIAGKGHEEGQTIGNITHPFDDRLVARKLLDELRESG